MYIKKNNVMRKLYTILTMGLCVLCATLLLTSCNNKKNTTKFVENPDMEYRTLGSTGLRVGVIGLGCGGFEEIDSATSRELVTAALDRGMNYMDIYDANPKVRSNIGYGLGDRRNEMIIQGHIGCWWNGESYERTRDVEKCKKGFEDLLTRLHTDYIDVGMMHIFDKMEDWEAVQGSEYLQYVKDLKAQGKIKHIGVSSHNAKVALAIAKSGLVEVIMFSLNPAFDRTQPDASPWDPETFNNMLACIDPVRMELYDYCSQHDIAITVMKAYGGGDRLLDAEKSPLKVALTRDQCVAYALSKPCVAVSLCSASNANQLDEYLHCLKATDAENDGAGGHERRPGRVHLLQTLRSLSGGHRHRSRQQVAGPGQTGGQRFQGAGCGVCKAQAARRRLSAVRGLRRSLPL